MKERAAVGGQYEEVLHQAEMCASGVTNQSALWKQIEEALEHSSSTINLSITTACIW
jgi:hypothetical protein